MQGWTLTMCQKLAPLVNCALPHMHRPHHHPHHCTTPPRPKTKKEKILAKLAKQKERKVESRDTQVRDKAL